MLFTLYTFGIRIPANPTLKKEGDYTGIRGVWGSDREEKYNLKSDQLPRFNSTTYQDFNPSAFKPKFLNFPNFFQSVILLISY
jgi:hypothetical protein